LQLRPHPWPGADKQVRPFQPQLLGDVEAGGIAYAVDELEGLGLALLHAHGVEQRAHGRPRRVARGQVQAAVAAYMFLEQGGAEQGLEDQAVDAAWRAAQVLAERGLQRLVVELGAAVDLAGGNHLHSAIPCSTRLALLPPKPKKLASS